MAKEAPYTLKKAIAEVKAHAKARDYEAARSVEDEIYAAFITAIAEAEMIDLKRVQRTAREILALRKLDFPRWAS